MGNSDSKRVFKSIFEDLCREEIQDPTYWTRFFSTSFSLPALQAAFTSDEIRSLINICPNNLSALVLRSLEIMEETWHQVLELDDNRVLMTENAVKILARLVPVSLEFQYSELLDFWWGETRLAFRLLKAVQGLSFTPGYSLLQCFNTESIDHYYEVHGRLLWKSGLITDQAPKASKSMWGRKSDILTLLLAALSEHLTDQSSPWLTLLVSQANLYSAQTFYNLLNLTLTYTHKSFVGLPYTEHFNDPVQDNVYKAAINILIIALNFEPKPNLALEILEEQGVTFNATNEFTLRLGSISQEQDLEFICSNLIRLMKNDLEVKEVYFPHSKKPLGTGPQAVVLFWEFLMYNPRGVEFVVGKCDILGALQALLFHMQEGEFGLFSICSSTLLMLSKSRRFCVSLNSKKSADKSYADELVERIVSFMYDDEVLPVIPELLSTLSNVSPYLKHINHQSSISLLDLFQEFSKKSFFLANPTNHHYVIYILEFIRNVVQYQWDGAYYLVLELLRKRSSVFKLWRMEVSGNDDSADEDQLTEGEVLFDDEDELPDQLEESKDDVEDENRELSLDNRVEFNNEDDEWRPTEAWLMRLKQHLPIKDLLEVIHYFRDIIVEYCRENPRSSDENLVEIIRNQSIVGIVGPPPPINIRECVPDVQYSLYIEKLVASYFQELV